MEVRIQATSILGWPVWVVKVGEPIDGERPVRFINSLKKSTIFTEEEAQELLPFVLKVREDARIIPAVLKG